MFARNLATATVPQPELSPFFNLLETSRRHGEDDEGPPVAARDRQDSAQGGGSDGDRGLDFHIRLHWDQDFCSGFTAHAHDVPQRRDRSPPDKTTGCR
jgi:hypothetical protein